MTGRNTNHYTTSEDVSAGLVPRSGGKPSDLSCYACGVGVDRADHVFGSCEVISLPVARVRFFEMNNLTPTPGIAGPLLARSFVSLHDTTATVAFNHAVWHTLHSDLSKLSTKLHSDQVIARVLARASVALNSIIGGKRADADKVKDLAITPPSGAIVAYTDGSADKGHAKCGAGLWISVEFPLHLISSNAPFTM